MDSKMKLAAQGRHGCSQIYLATEPSQLIRVKSSLPKTFYCHACFVPRIRFVWVLTGLGWRVLYDSDMHVLAVSSCNS